MYMTNPNDKTSHKQFAFESTGGKGRYRIPLPPDKEGEYTAEKFLLSHEESDYIMRKGKGFPYATYTTDDQEMNQEMLMNGFIDGEHLPWKEVFSYWKDNQGHSWLFPEDAPINDHRDLGIQVEMEKPGESLKVGKYMNRILQAFPKDPFTKESLCVWGKEVSFNPFDNSALVVIEEDPYAADKLDEEQRSLTIRYVDLKTLNEEQRALVDGSLVFSDKAVRLLKLIPKDAIDQEPKLGMAWRVTVATERGLGKGHAVYKNDMDYDIVIYGPKTIIKTDCFFFGSNGPLHAGVPHTDRQAVVNFHMHRKGMLVELAKKYMREVLQSSADEKALRALFLYHTRELDQQELDEEGWALRRALTYGISFLRFPGLYRRVVNYLMKKVMAIELKSRVPMDSRTYSVAKYAYVLPDINAIDSQGDIHPENAIKENTLIFPDLKPGTKVVAYRQPSENTNAWVPLTITGSPAYKAFRGRGVCLLGRGAHNVLGRLGGGDMDDSFVIVHDPFWVEQFHTMRPYPETEKLSAETAEEDLYSDEETRSELAQFTESLLEDIRDRNMKFYTKKHVAWQMKMAKNARSGIGPVVNFGIIDMLMSDPDHKASMIADLKSKSPEAMEWLLDRDAYQAALYMTNLEVIIDGNVKDTTLLKQLGDVSGTIKAFHKDCPVYPTSQLGHIPESKRNKADFVLARSLTCRALEQIRMLVDTLEQVFIEREWNLVAPAEKDLRTVFPREAEIAKLVGGEWRRGPEGYTRTSEDTFLKEIWATEWINRQPNETMEVAYPRVMDRLRAEVADRTPEEMQRIAVEIYYQTYRTWGTVPKVDDQGKLRHYPDGLLWSPVFANHFIDALREARLSGYYRAVTIRPELRRVLRELSVMVEIRNLNVYIEDENGEFKKWIGLSSARYPSGKPINGKFPMDSGIVCFREGAAIVQPADPDMMAQRTLTRLIPQKEDEVQAKLPEAKGVFAKLLRKALDYLK